MPQRCFLHGPVPVAITPDSHYHIYSMSSTVHEKQILIEPVAVKAWAENRHVFIELHDDRIISFPARKFSRLNSATDDQLAQVRIRAQGSALRWDAIDEDLLVDGIVRGIFEED
jgi:hypothetical protein